jgi:hypothetical protein
VTATWTPSRTGTAKKISAARARTIADRWPPALHRRVGVDLNYSDLDALRVRVGVVYGALVVVIILVALAFGAGRRSASSPAA